MSKLRRTPWEVPGSPCASLLLNAAVEVFLEHGFFEAGLEQICAAAKMSKGSLCHHYASKEHLVVAACADALRSKTGFVAANRIISLHIPELYSIVRGKVGKKVEFGLSWGMGRL